jgi:hypothetical protein
MAQKQKKNAAKLTTTKPQITNISQFRWVDPLGSGALPSVRPVERRSAASVTGRLLERGSVII